MKVSLLFFAAPIIALVLSKCSPASIPVTPTITEKQHTMLSPIRPTRTLTPGYTGIPTIALSSTPAPSPTQTETALPPTTLEPKQAAELIKTLSQEPADCIRPCFWGIIPDTTKLAEAENILTYLGLELIGKDTHFGTSFELDSGLSMHIRISGNTGIVRNVSVYITPEEQKAGVQREWLAFSPETLIQRYGSPSKVELFLGRGPDTPLGIDIYYDKLNLIIEYNISSIGSNTQICPLKVQFDTVWIWLGKNPVYPPFAGEPLEKTTDLTIEEFSKLMTGDPDKACFELKPDMFP